MIFSVSDNLIVITLLFSCNKLEQSKLATNWALLQPSFLLSAITSWSCDNNGRTNPQLQIAILYAQEVLLLWMFARQSLWKSGAPIGPSNTDQLPCNNAVSVSGFTRPRQSLITFSRNLAGYTLSAVTMINWLKIEIEIGN